MMKPFKLRRQDTFRTGKENGFRKFFRNWLSVDGFGICRNRRSEKPQDADFTHKKATEVMEDVSHSEAASIAPKPPGDTDLYHLLKKRAAQSLSDPTDESGRNRSAEGSGKAVQE